MVRIGIIGCGNIGAEHIKGYKMNEKVNLVAVADINEKRARNTAQRCKARFYTNYEEMLKKEHLNGVSICTPPFLHKEMVLKALDSGVNVLCEKPLATNSKDAEEMIAHAKKKRLLLMTGFCNRFVQMNRKTRELIQKGELGKIVMFRNRFAGKLDMTGKWFSDKKKSGGGVLLDTSIHSVDLFRWLVGEVKTVSAKITKFILREVEDSSIILLESTRGAIGVIEASWVSPKGNYGIEIYGTRGVAIIDYNTFTLRYSLADGKWQEINYPREGFKPEIDNFVNSILGEETLFVEPEAGIKSLQIIEASYQSAKEGKQINVK